MTEFNLEPELTKIKEIKDTKTIQYSVLSKYAIYELIYGLLTIIYCYSCLNLIHVISDKKLVICSLYSVYTDIFEV